MRKRWNRCDSNRTLAKATSRLVFIITTSKAITTAALRELKLAAEALPNDGDVGLYTAAVQRRRGDLTQALAAYQHAEQIDPRNSVMLYDASQTYFGLRDWRTAAERMDRVLALSPDSFNVKVQRAYVEFLWKGSTAPIKAALQSLPPNFDPDGVRHLRALGRELDGPRCRRRRESPGELSARHDHLADGSRAAKKLSSGVC